MKTILIFLLVCVLNSAFCADFFGKYAPVNKKAYKTAFIKNEPLESFPANERQKYRKLLKLYDDPQSESRKLMLSHFLSTHYDMQMSDIYKKFDQVAKKYNNGKKINVKNLWNKVRNSYLAKQKTAKKGFSTGYVTRVKDGDSFLMRSKGVIHEIRLYGIDAPEYSQAGGKAAKKALRKLIASKTVKVEVVSTGTYNRLIGKVHVGKKYVNLELVKTGNAHWYKRYAPKDKELAAAEKSAQKSKTGIWSGLTPPINPEKHRHTPKLK